jgi:hypothetical protein
VLANGLASAKNVFLPVDRQQPAALGDLHPEGLPKLFNALFVGHCHRRIPGPHPV